MEPLQSRCGPVVLFQHQKRLERGCNAEDSGGFGGCEENDDGFGSGHSDGQDGLEI